MNHAAQKRVCVMHLKRNIDSVDFSLCESWIVNVRRDRVTYRVANQTSDRCLRINCMDAIEFANFPCRSLSWRGGALITHRSVRQKRSARRPEDPGHLASLTHGNGNRPAPFITPAIEKVKNSNAIES